MVGVQEIHHNMLLHHSSVKTAEMFPQSLERTVNPVVTTSGSIYNEKQSPSPPYQNAAISQQPATIQEGPIVILHSFQEIPVLPHLLITRFVRSYVYQLSLSSDTKIEWQESVLAASQLGSLIVNCWGTKQLGYRVHTSTKYFGWVIMVSRLQQPPCDDHQGWEIETRLSVCSLHHILQVNLFHRYIHIVHSRRMRRSCMNWRGRERPLVILMIYDLEYLPEDNNGT
jgi:hypothetical protein